MKNIVPEQLNRILSDTEITYGVYQLIDLYYQLSYECEPGEISEDYLLFRKAEIDIPVDNRPSGIGRALITLLEAGQNIDGSNGFFNALMLAVGNGDYHMTRFLLQHGADPNKWPLMDEDPGYTQNYYLESVDIHYYDEVFFNHCEDPLYVSDLEKTAAVLVNDGGLRNFQDLCLSVSDKGEIKFEIPKLKY